MAITFEDKPRLVPEGDFDFVIDNITKETRGGYDVLSVVFKIREDVDQGSKGLRVWETLFRDKNNPEWYNLAVLESLICTQSTGKGWKVTIDTCDDAIQYLIGKNLKATVAHTTNKNGDEKAEIKKFSYKQPSDFLAKSIQDVEDVIAEDNPVAEPKKEEPFPWDEN